MRHVLLILVLVGSMILAPTTVADSGIEFPSMLEWATQVWDGLKAKILPLDEALLPTENTQVESDGSGLPPAGNYGPFAEPGGEKYGPFIEPSGQTFDPNAIDAGNAPTNGESLGDPPNYGPFIEPNGSD